MSATQLENASFQVTNHKEHRKHVVVRLLAEGSVVVALIAIGWLGMWNVGSDTLSSQSDSLTAARETIYIGVCPVPAPLQKSSTRGVLARAEAVLTKVRLTRSPHASREWD